ncbi:pirin family protein [Gangjinia marincola]|uniref:Pirin family protein n=1 Tax=Gangjinia marincola TaxID=578463 RepID=A0ABP3XU80_9FLAO
MKKTVYPAHTRGKADYGWLKANYSFSFANYFNPDRIKFGALRVLNDDVIAPGKGFGTHPHQNMEIVSIPLDGKLAHKDSMGHEEIIKTGEVQVMSAGTGVEHSEYNPSTTEATNLLQVWILPQANGVSPRYDQRSFSLRKNELKTVVTPRDNTTDDSLWLNQQTYFNLGEFDQDNSHTYTINQSGHGVYMFVIEGSLMCEGEKLEKRDALGVWETDSISFTTTAPSKILVIEIPMN